MARRNSNGPLTFVMVIVTGAVGLLAGYGALQLLPSLPEKTVVAPTAPAKPVQQPKQQAAREPIQPPRRQSRVPSVQREAVRDEATKAAVAVEETPAAKPPIPTRRAPQTHSIALELTRTVQTERLEKLPIRIARIDGCNFTLEPSDGSFAKGPVTIVLTGPRPITIEAKLRQTSASVNLDLRPSVRSDAGNDIPFTIESIERIGRKLTTDGQRATSRVSALVAEKNRLQAWIDSPVVKPLAARGQAVARVNEINVLVPEGTAAIKALESEVVATSALFKFANDISGRCQVVLEFAE